MEGLKKVVAGGVFHMKKNMIIISLSAILVFILIYINFGKTVEHEVLQTENYPTFIQDAIQDNHDKNGFSVFQDDSNTYIYYKSDSVPNEYISTNLDLKYRGGKYIAIATVKPAVNIPNTERLIKLNKIVDKDLVLKVNIK